MSSFPHKLPWFNSLSPRNPSPSSLLGWLAHPHWCLCAYSVSSFFMYIHLFSTWDSAHSAHPPRTVFNWIGFRIPPPSTFSRKENKKSYPIIYTWAWMCVIYLFQNASVHKEQDNKMMTLINYESRCHSFFSIFPVLRTSTWEHGVPQMHSLLFYC